MIRERAIQIQRTNYAIDGISQGLKGASQIYDYVDNRIWQVGHETQLWTIDTLGELKGLVAKVEIASPYEDHKLKTDLWVEFENNCHQPVGIQVKSSRGGVQKFLREHPFAYTNRLMALASGIRYEKEEVQHKFLSILHDLDGYI